MVWLQTCTCVYKQTHINYIEILLADGEVLVSIVLLNTNQQVAYNTGAFRTVKNDMPYRSECSIFYTCVHKP